MQLPELKGGGGGGLGGVLQFMYIYSWICMKQFYMLNVTQLLVDLQAVVEVQKQLQSISHDGGLL